MISLMSCGRLVAVSGISSLWIGSYGTTIGASPLVGGCPVVHCVSIVEGVQFSWWFVFVGNGFVANVKPLWR